MERERELREGVRRAYGAAADRPDREHPFPVGRAFAESLGYPTSLLDRFPEPCVEAFTGVSSVALFAEIPPGAVVLDLGCGAGLDSLIAAERTGARGRVVGVDFSASMLDRARRAASRMGAENVEFLESDAESLPVDDRSVDVALVNGIFNLNPARDAIFRELGRVVRPAGVVYAAELALRAPLPRRESEGDANWFA